MAFCREGSVSLTTPENQWILIFTAMECPAESLAALLT
jgi:hypothetical protein